MRAENFGFACATYGYGVLQAYSTGGAAPHFLKVKKKVQVHSAAHFLKVKKKRWYIPEGTFLKGDRGCRGGVRPP